MMYSVFFQYFFLSGSTESNIRIEIVFNGIFCQQKRSSTKLQVLIKPNQSISSAGLLINRSISGKNILANQNLNISELNPQDPFVNYDKTSELLTTVFNVLSDEQPLLPLSILKNTLELHGIEWNNDPRLATTRNNLQSWRDMGVNAGDLSLRSHMNYEEFVQVIGSDYDTLRFISKALSRQFVIPDFQRFVVKIKEIYDSLANEQSGALANYIPQLARQDPNKFGIAGCTVDGQRFSLGDANEPFCLQSCVKPLQYAVAISESSTEHVHQYIGKEPSGHNFNAIILDSEQKPHNPMINIGAIVCCSLIKPHAPMAERFDFITDIIKDCAAGEHVSFNNSVFQSEKATSYRNMAIGYFLKENKCLPSNCNIEEIIDLYLQLCAITTTCKSGSVISATLANGGVNPFFAKRRVLSSVAVQNTLSLMHSCGMYDFSGVFAFYVGLPSKSGVAGGLMLVVPNVMGIMIWSPLLDQRGNTVRGTKFCMSLMDHFNFHVYDNLRHCVQKSDPRKLTVPLTEKEELIGNLSQEIFGQPKK